MKEETGQAQPQLYGTQYFSVRIALTGQEHFVGSMSGHALCKRVRALGAAIGITPLSPHDCRHYWATSAVRGGSDIRSLQDAGGWRSPAMPLRYVEAGKIANEGIRLG